MYTQTNIILRKFTQSQTEACLQQVNYTVIGGGEEQFNKETTFVNF